MSENVIFLHAILMTFATFAISLAAGLIAQRIQTLTVGPGLVPAIEPPLLFTSDPTRRKNRRPFRLATRQVAGVRFSRASAKN